MRSVPAQLRHGLRLQVYVGGKKQGVLSPEEEQEKGEKHIAFLPLFFLFSAFLLPFFLSLSLSLSLSLAANSGQSVNEHGG